MVILYVSLVVFGCARHNFAQHWTCWVGVFVCVCACMSAPPTKFSLFTNTHLFIGQIRKSVCTCVSVCICYLPACKSGLRSVHSELDRSIDRFVNNEILDGKWVFFFFFFKQMNCSVQKLLLVNSPQPWCE